MSAIPIDRSTPIENRVVPLLKEKMRLCGCAVISYKRDYVLPGIELDLISVILLCGRSLASNMSHTILRGCSDSNYLPIHTESIYSRLVTPYFALGCLEAPKSGGETRIFDARKAASVLESEHPQLSKVAINYASKPNPHLNAVCPLVYHDPTYGKVLRFRDKTPDNAVNDVPVGYNEDQIYHIVRKTAHKCIYLTHTWHVGDIIFVNNRITLHDRLPYVGSRKMLRVRFDDPHNTKLSFV